MVHIRRSTVIHAPIDRVWAILRDFNGHDRWHPAVADSEIEGGLETDMIGATRSFHLAGGEHLREQLLALSDSDYSFSYCLVETPIPLDGYVAHLRLMPVTDGDATYWDWQSRFVPPPGRERELAELVGDGVYEAGFAAIRTLLEPAPAASRQAAGVAPASAVRPGPTRESVPGRTPSRHDERTSAASGREAAAQATAALSSPPTVMSGSVTATTMVLERFGGPECLQPGSNDVPAPATHEARIRHTAIGLNYIDVYSREGRLRLVEPPGVLGLEAVGVVVDGGESAGLRPGERVGYATLPAGAYCTVRTMPADRLVRLPDDIADETAAAVLVKGLTAEFLLHRVHRLQAGETVLVHAAAGGVGSLLVQWAKALGARVFGTVGNPEKAALARANGCDAVIEYRDTDFVEAVLALTDGRGVDLVVDGVGRASFAGSVAVCARRGHVISYGQASGDIGAWNIDSLATRSLTISRPNFADYTSSRSDLANGSERLFEALRRGIIKPQIGRRFALSEAAEAHRWLEGRDSVGANLLIP
ncbi:MAG: zinc-binding dehydrogenase [Burkholderiaceae bacterium]